MRPDKTMLEMLRARVSRDQKRAIEEAARKRGMTLSEFLRDTATEAARRVSA